MNYIHVKNLEKYNPGYTDREAIWAKLYFSILDDYEFGSLCEIDKWRFICLILIETKTKKPVPVDNLYLERFGFSDLKKRPISLTLDMLHNFLETVTQDLKECNVEKRREEKNREEYSESVICSIQTKWNDFCAINKSTSCVKELTKTREAKLKSRLKNHLFNIDEIISSLNEQPFLLGDNDRKWTVSFDWIIENESNFIKVLEKQYVSKTSTNKDTRRYL